jgi:hypothetical protein
VFECVIVFFLFSLMLLLKEFIIRMKLEIHGDSKAPTK